MPHDAEFWRTAGETGGILGTVLTPFALAVSAAVKKHRKEHPPESEEGEATEPRTKRGKRDPCADLKETVARLEHENLRLCEQVERANDRAEKADARAGRLQEWIDGRTAPKPQPDATPP